MDCDNTMKRDLKSTIKHNGYEIHPKFPDGFRIRKLPTGKKTFQVDCGRSSGKHTRKTFETITDARQWANEKYKERKKIGDHAFDLSDSDRLDASKALEIAKRFPSGNRHVSLTQMALFYEDHHRSSDHTRQTGKLIEQYLAFQSNRYDLGELRQSSLSSCKQFVGKRFKEKFSNQTINTITHVQIDKFLDSLVSTKINANGDDIRVGIPNRRSHKSYIGGFFKWVLKYHDVLTKNPMEKTRKVPNDLDDPEIYTPTEIKIMLHHADAILVPYMAVQLFGGARATEATRIRWNHISWSTNEIKLPKEVTKGRRGRILHMKPNLIKILKAHRPEKEEGLICDMPTKTIEKRLRELRKAHGIKNIHSGFRHCFCTYSVAKFDIGKTMMESGHKSSQQLIDH